MRQEADREARVTREQRLETSAGERQLAREPCSPQPAHTLPYMLSPNKPSHAANTPTPTFLSSAFCRRCFPFHKAEAHDTRTPAHLAPRITSAHQLISACKTQLGNRQHHALDFKKRVKPFLKGLFIFQFLQNKFI